MSDEKQTIELTEKQFEALLKLVYLGNWMANACRDGSPDDPQIPEYESMEDYIFSLAPRFGFEKYLDREAGDGEKCFPSRLFEEETDVNCLHSEYDENTFWDELPEWLGERDFYEKYSKKEIGKMTRDERFEKIYECIDVYGEELEKFGLDRMRVKKE